MLSKLRMKPKLIAVFGLVGVLPLAVASWIAYAKAGTALADSERAAGAALEQQVFEQLTSAREIKRATIERYFQQIEDQILTFSEDRMIVDAMNDFRQVFSAVPQNDDLSSEQDDDLSSEQDDELLSEAEKLDRMRDQLWTYYSEEFAEEYRSQTGMEPAGLRERFDQLDADSVALQHAYVWANTYPLGSKHLLDRSPDASAYGDVHERVHPIVRNYLEKFGYYDIFLVDPITGDIIYSVFKELDYTTSLIDGPYANTNFARAFQEANSGDDSSHVVLVDFEQYMPSYEAPASFIASPIFDGSRKVGIAIFQMPLNRISEVMGQRAGLGNTGETYLVGPDSLMRSDSFRDPEHRTVSASFRNPGTGRVDSTAVQAALAGSSGSEVTQNYGGDEVLSAFAPVQIGALRWALVAEMSTAEAFVPVAQIAEQTASAQASLLRWVGGVAAVSILAIVLVALGVAMKITGPLREIVGRLQDIAQGDGDLTQRLRVLSRDEIGDVAHWFNEFVAKIQGTVQTIAGDAETLTHASETMTATSQRTSDSASRTVDQAAAASSASTRVNETVQALAAATPQMEAAIKEISEGASKAARAATQAVQVSEAATDAVNKLGASSTEIKQVVDLIESVAAQTNLLALNATIEAARAGAAGKGFAVVATEVKELANQTARATDGIRDQISAIQASSETAAVTITQGGAAINEVNDYARTIAAAVEEQSVTTLEMSRRVEEAASSLGEITANISGAAAATEDTNASTAEGQTAARELALMANKLRTVVEQFKYRDDSEVAVSVESSHDAEPVLPRAA
jgi:methyl-accepting chemotaxis protein